MNDERDLLVFTDDDGQEVQMEIIDYFEYEGQEYAMLVEADADDCENDCGDDCEDESADECGCGCGCDDEKNIYIMKVVVDGDTEEFIPVEEEKIDELIEVIQAMYDEEDDEDDEE